MQFPVPDAERCRSQGTWCYPQEEYTIPQVDGSTFPLNLGPHGGEPRSAFDLEERLCIYMRISP